MLGGEHKSYIALFTKIILVINHIPEHGVMNIAKLKCSSLLCDIETIENMRPSTDVDEVDGALISM